MIDRRKLLLSLLTPILAGSVLVGSTFASSKKKDPSSTTAQTKDAPTPADKTASTAAAPTHTTVSSSEVASARSKGLVWVNTDSRVYHKDGRYYGNTKQGKFMSEADAEKAGYKAAKK
jgi:hypothetical protein